METEPLHNSFDKTTLNRRDELIFAPTCKDIPEIYYDQDGFVESWGDTVSSYKEHRNGEESNEDYSNTLQNRAKKKYAQILDLDRWTRQEYDNRSVVLLSLRLSPIAGDAYLDPLTQIDLLAEAFPSREIRSVLSEHEYEYARVLAGTDRFASGHWHAVLYVDGDVSSEDFRPVCRSFIDAIPTMDTIEGNRPEDGVISVRREEDLTYEEYPGDDDRQPVTGATTYVAGQLPHLQDLDDASKADLLWNSAMHASERRPFYRSKCIDREDVKIRSLDSPVVRRTLTTDPLPSDLQIHSTPPNPARPIQSMDTISIGRSKKPPPMHAD